ncbi:MAG: SynChlorMet cassette radical SAM/SPASM protein ScmE [Dehalobacter sp.]|nr:SynChlorMet cassette radical SAM/SPASM protein ScmE [Dehalobacter sp.]
MAPVPPVMKTPRSLTIEITSNCNLRCLYCSHFSSPGETADLPKEEWLQFFGELNKCAVMDLTLTGGEVFVRKDIKDIIDGIVQNRMRYSILSNGTLITDDMAAYLASTGRCSYVQVSIDSFDAAGHDACRGKGSFQKAVRGLKSLINNNVPATVRVTVNKNNVNDLEKIARFLLDDIKIPSFSTNAASYLGTCQENNQIQLSVQDRTIAMETLLKLSNEYPGRVVAQAGPLAEVRMWREMVKASKEGTACSHSGGYLIGCGCIFKDLAVRSDGVLIPCSYLSHIELGRINKDDLKEVWQNHPELKRMRARRSIPLSDFEFCRDCKYMKYCTGNCPALSYSVQGDMYSPSMDACLRLFLQQGGKLPT